MGVTVIGAQGPLEDWRIEADRDEPKAVHDACAMLTQQTQAGTRGRPNTRLIEAIMMTARESQRRDEGRPTEAMRRGMFAIATGLGLSREERLGLAEMILMRDIQSWNDFTFDDARRMLDAMNGYLLIRQLRIDKDVND